MMLANFGFCCPRRGYLELSTTLYLCKAALEFLFSGFGELEVRPLRGTSVVWSTTVG